MQRGYYWDPKEPKIVKQEQKEDSTFLTLNKVRNFRKSNISLAAASITNQGPQQVLSRKQLEQCGLAYINNGIVRSVIDKTVYFIHGERSNFVVEPNDELTEGLDDKETRDLKDKINQSPDIQELRRKIVRINKRVQLWDFSTKLLTSSLVFGRGALKIARFPKTEGWLQFGEPKALMHLNSMRLTQAKEDSDGLFTGFEYDDNFNKQTINAEKLIPAFHDDNGIKDNSNYSGLSAVWPILEASNVIEAIIAEDMPEIARQFYAKLLIVYAGTNKKSTLKQLQQELTGGGVSLIHNEEQLKAEVHDLARDPNELMQVVAALSQYICRSTSLPEFLLFEDTANFSTADKVMQSYKAGMLKRYRTWFQGILEKYWYDPILADHLNIDLKDVISADIKIKAIFPDINFETKLDVITGAEKLQAMQVYKPMDTAKDIDRPDLVARLEEEEQQRLEAEQAIQDAVNRQREEAIKGQQIANKVSAQTGVPPKINKAQSTNDQ